MYVYVRNRTNILYVIVQISCLKVQMSLHTHLITPRTNEAIDRFRSTPSLSHRSRLHKMTDIIFNSRNVSNGEHNPVDVHVGSRVRLRRISVGSKYPPAKPGALSFGPLKAA